MWNVFEKQPFFRADTARLGKYRMAGYGWIGVYRVYMYTVKSNHCKLTVTSTVDIVPSAGNKVSSRCYCLITEPSVLHGIPVTFLDINLLL